MSYNNYCLIDYIPEILVYSGEQHVINVTVTNQQGLPKTLGGLDWDFIMCEYGKTFTSDINNIVKEGVTFDSTTNIISIILNKNNTLNKNGKYKFQIKYLETLNPESLGPCTITIATPAVITLENHGLSANEPIIFVTNGALPDGITPKIIYYVSPSDLGVNTFKISDTQNGTVINTSGAQSGSHSVYLSIGTNSRMIVAAQGIMNIIPTNMTTSIS